MELKLRINFARPGRNFLIGFGLIAVVGLLIILLVSHKPSTVPADFRRQASFSVISPPAAAVKDTADSFHYSASDKTLIFNMKYQGINLAVTEQSAPDSLTGSGVFFQALGLHPVAQFQAKTGQVAIVNFYQTGTLAEVGQTGLLVAKKTLVSVKPIDAKQKLTNDQWKTLFDSFSQ